MSEQSERMEKPSVTSNASSDSQLHETTVQHTRYGILVYVPGWWAGRDVRVILLPANAHPHGRAPARTVQGVVGASGSPNPG